MLNHFLVQPIYQALLRTEKPLFKLGPTVQFTCRKTLIQSSYTISKRYTYHPGGGAPNIAHIFSRLIFFCTTDGVEKRDEKRSTELYWSCFGRMTMTPLGSSSGTAEIFEKFFFQTLDFFESVDGEKMFVQRVIREVCSL